MKPLSLLCIVHVSIVVLLCLVAVHGIDARSDAGNLTEFEVNTKKIKGLSDLVAYLKKQKLGPAYKCRCGVSNNHADRIVGGEEASPNEFPWQVGICEEYDRPYCGGALINDLYVLTAGHCVDGRVEDEVMVVISEHNIDETNSKAYYIPVQKLIAHPRYEEEGFHNDIALIRIADRIPYSDIALPVCFPRPNLNYEGEMGVVAGWGRVSEGDEPSSVLLKVELPIISWEQCFTYYQGKMEIFRTVLCTSWKEGEKDACEGDSGGPLIWKNNNRWYLIGVVSWGLGCARPDTPAAFTRVDKYYRWINNHIKNATACDN